MSMVRVAHLLFIVTAFLVSMVQTPTSAYSFWTKFTVHIINDFKSNQNPLQMHCRSEDDDLGAHTLWMKNEFYFKFGEKPFGWTHFWCDMQHGAQKRAFDVYDSHYPDYKCHKTEQCYWAVREDGFYFSDNQRDWKKASGWIDK